MEIKYYDEPIIGRSKIPVKELDRKIEKLEIKNYGHVLPKSVSKVSKKARRKTIYSLKKKCLVYKDTGEKVVF